MKSFVAQFSDLSGGLNPSGIWSPTFLALKRAVEAQAPSAEPQVPFSQLEHALYAWAAERRISEAELDDLLELPPEEAVQEFATKLRLGTQTGRIAPEAVALVHAAFKQVYSARVRRAAERLENDYISGMGRLTAARDRHGLGSARDVVETLLA